MAALVPTVLMGDPAHFRVLGGANPHTRDRFGWRKRVDRDLAVCQWQRLHDLLVDLGLRVHVIAPDPALPGLVYPANAGFRIGDDFVLSHLVPTRAAEASTYREAVASLGLRPHAIPSRFEGEADLFPAGDSYLFTFGEIRRQRFAPRAGWPPWKRLYGFRSEPQALVEIGNIRPLDRPVYALRLSDERYYHGDTCLCAFGPGRTSLLAYRPALDAGGAARLDAAFGDRQLALSDRDAEIYAANSFHLELDGECLLIMPEGISERLEDQVRSRGARVLKVDVSEFHKKGGGSVKCMIGDLGELP